MNTQELFEIMGNDSDFPIKLQNIKPTIKKLYGIGDFGLLNKKILGIVGPREMSQYGNQVLEAFFDEVKWCDFVTVSGLARGVDQKCHNLSLKYWVSTVAILGWWIDVYMKKSDRYLIEKIVDNGWLILSEFEMDFEPTKWSFPKRNRIIAGLSDVIFLPEAREGSGSLITAEYAVQMKKQVFVAPSPFFAMNGKGSNKFVADKKWILLSSFEQILACFDGGLKNKCERWWSMVVESRNDKKDKIWNSLTESEKQIFELVKWHLNQELSVRSSSSNLEFWELMMWLTILEMKWIVRQDRPWFYVVE